jgi:hypothetical protein
MRKPRNTSLIYKVIAFAVCLLTTTVAYSDSVQIEHPREDRAVTLEIPETYEELREAYIEVSKLYLGERADLEDALEINSELRQRITELEAQIADLFLLQHDLVSNNEELQDRQTTTIQQVVSVGSRVNFDGSYGGSVGFGMMFQESVIGTLHVGFPLSLGIEVSYTW